ncbi:hypothetical protein CEUSTIGMA_g11951.t1 [Chlamydomonas eustigma]|uniref:Uncharacterized protein n=1 Tax=Chlamydomonas eustigma TaxID=1157962 RepID=A0A250XP06_9CHLO|nr:hypothetical protein CEUSTIGMA_g11951.t1 [Chlamydomonas eustigma]|eukprot:GAX84530.1 hypothetical protein CEUSTIGMA_g11951.t1 [Chlamydomonas eustigma]
MSSSLITSLYHLTSKQITPALLTSAFYDAGRDALTTLFQESTTLPYTSTTNLDGQGHTVSSLLDKAYHAVIAAGAYDTTDVPTFSPEVLNAMMLILQPVFLFTMLSAINSSTALGFVTQMYASAAMYVAASVGISRLAGTFTGTTSSDYQKLSSIALNVINVVYNAIGAGYDNKIIENIMDVSNSAKLQSQELASQYASLKTRLVKANDMQATFSVDSVDVSRARRTFYCWLAAYITVFVASVYLIWSDRIPSFLSLSASVLGLVTVVLLATWIYRLIANRNGIKSYV